MTGRHPTGQGGGEQRSGPPTPPPRSPPGLQAAGAPTLRPPGSRGPPPYPKRDRDAGGGLGWVGLDSPDLKNATDPSIEKFGSPGSGAIIGVV